MPDFVLPDEYPYVDAGQPGAEPLRSADYNALLDAVADLASAGGRVPDLETHPLIAANLTGAAVGRVAAVADSSPLGFGLMRYFEVLACNPDLLIAGTITRDGNGAATSAPVVWPDGRPGVYTATTVSAAFPGAVDAYTITYDAAGADPDLTFTQPAVTRDASGAVTARPAITVA